MEPEPPTPETLPPPEAPPPSRTSLAARLLNIFATPGDVFEEVKVSAPSTGNWLVPMLLFGLVASVASFLILSQPAFTQKMREGQAKVYEKQVAAGKMTQADADRVMESMEKISGPIGKIFGVVGSFVAAFFTVFWWAFLLWLIARFCLKVPLPFGKGLEVAGLAGAICVLEAAVRLLLVFGFNNPMASPSLGMLAKDADPQSTQFTVLNMVDIMTFWALAVRSIGLARLTGVSFGRAAIWVLGAWILMMSVFVGFSVMMQRAFGG
jgi:hypothetical protein